MNAKEMIVGAVAAAARYRDAAKRESFARLLSCTDGLGDHDLAEAAGLDAQVLDHAIAQATRQSSTWAALCALLPVMGCTSTDWPISWLEEGGEDWSTIGHGERRCILRAFVRATIEAGYHLGEAGDAEPDTVYVAVEEEMLTVAFLDVRDAAAWLRARGCSLSVTEIEQLLDRQTFVYRDSRPSGFTPEPEDGRAMATPRLEAMPVRRHRRRPGGA